jgi:hypothetical protein
MNFRPELADKVMAGEKTVTRRLVSENPRSPWYVGACSLKVDHTYAVCPGRGKHAIGRVRVTRVRREPLGILGLGEACAEGFSTMFAFREAWRTINGGLRPDRARLARRVRRRAGRGHLALGVCGVSVDTTVYVHSDDQSPCSEPALCHRPHARSTPRPRAHVGMPDGWRDVPMPPGVAALPRTNAPGSRSPTRSRGRASGDGRPLATPT